MPIITGIMTNRQVGYERIRAEVQTPLKKSQKRVFFQFVDSVEEKRRRQRNISALNHKSILEKSGTGLFFGIIL